MRHIDGGTLMQNLDMKEERDKLRDIVTYMASNITYLHTNIRDFRMIIVELHMNMIWTEIILFQIDHRAAQKPQTSATTPETKSPSHLTKDNDDVIKSRLFTISSGGLEKDQDSDDPLSNKLFYLGGKRSPRLRKDPKWMSVRSVEVNKLSINVAFKIFV